MDGPRDLKFEMTARATGREQAIGEERDMTSRNRDKVLKYRGEAGLREFEARAEQFAVSSLGRYSVFLPYRHTVLITRQDMLRAEEASSQGHRRRIVDEEREYTEQAR